MTARDPLAAIRARLAEVTASWQAAESLAQIRASFADYLAEVGPRGAAMARP
ncbi:alpha/beta hydrolase, partial [Bordetella bronchiseptica]